MFRRLPVSRCRVIPVEEYKERDAPFAYYYPPSADTTRPGHLLRQHLRPAVPDVLAPRGDDLPRGDPGPPLPDRARGREHGAQQLPALRLALRRRRVRRGLGPVRRAPRRRDGPLPQRGRALRDARRPGLAGRPARRRHGHARPPLDAPAVDRQAPRGRPHRDRRGHRDRPLHRLAGPGPDVQGRAARDRAAAPRDQRSATARRSTSASSTTSSSATARCPSRPSPASSRSWVATPV